MEVAFSSYFLTFQLFPSDLAFANSILDFSLFSLLTIFVCLQKLNTKSSDQVPGRPPLSSAWLISSAQRRALPCPAVLYCAMLYRDVPCCASFTLSYRCHSKYVSYQLPVHQVCTYYVVESQRLHSQLSSAPLSYSSAAQRSTVQCRAVLCRVALAFFRTYS